MALPLEGPLPQIDLVGGATVTIEAVDPTTGAAVAGVVFSSGVIYAEGEGQGEGTENLSLAAQYLLGRGN